jgi:hypothetical protein
MHDIWSRSAFRVVATVLFGSTLTSSVCLAASPTQLLGSLIGSVADNSGIPQMGAVVKLYNRNDRLIEQAVTSAEGAFSFPALTPGIYSVRVSVSSFVPALRRNISVQPGMQSVLAVNMATLLSSVELVYTSRNPGTLMSDDWKWVLRSTMTTRPVTRMVPGVDISDPNQASRVSTALFTDTRGVLRVSAGETSNPFATAGNQADLGTTFALATSLFGSNQVQFSGNVGYGLNADLPAAGFRTSFSRGEAGPEVKLTMQQVGLGGLRGAPVLGMSANAPMLRTMSVTMLERMQVMEGLELDYGAALESVTYVDRLNYFSPFARLRYQIGDGTLDIGYSSGAPPIELLNRDVDDASLQNDMMAVSMLPRVSLRDGRAQVQRSENMEIGYRVQLGSRAYSVGAYHEFVRNAALTLSSGGGLFAPTELLPELSSNSSVFNIGNYTRAGMTVSVRQSLAEDWSATVAVGRGGVLTSDGTTVGAGGADDLRRSIRRAQRLWVRGILQGTAPVFGTRFITSYEWSDATTLTPGHVYLTQQIYPETGLNVRLRQPMPGWASLRGRLEATAELRNLLAQGYLPVGTSDGRRVVLAHFPRAVRGGLAFIF